jgi:hypothetical protein
MICSVKPQILLALILGVVLPACASTAGSPTPQATASPGLPATGPTAAPATSASSPSADDPPPAGAAREFNTDFSKHTIPYSEVLSGGPPKDGIPAIDDPRYVGVDEADAWLAEVEPVVLVRVDDHARAYPLQILTWHEIVNDTLGGTPLTVTFCPLCNTAIAFERTLENQVLDFGTTGRLRFSNLIMYDRQTETWWQQATGEAIAGELTGARLTLYPAAIISWEDFKSSHPDGDVLSRDTGFVKPYGQNPYGGYDNVDRSPFLYRGPDTPDVLPAMARVLTVDLGDEAVAYPYEVLMQVGVVNDIVDETEIVVLWQVGTASALDSSEIAQGRDVGAAGAYARSLDGRTLTFSLEGEQIVDDQTGSRWNVLGQAIEGELAGKSLAPVVSINHFWFSWAAFKPETRIFQP